MPLYEYLCEANGQIVEVVHGMSERYTTWGELCTAAKLDLGDTPAATPVTKLIGSGNATNGPVTLKKVQAAHGEKSKNLKHGPMAAPMRSSKY